MHMADTLSKVTYIAFSVYILPITFGFASAMLYYLCYKNVLCLHLPLYPQF